MSPRKTKARRAKRPARKPAGRKVAKKATKARRQARKPTRKAAPKAARKTSRGGPRKAHAGAPTEASLLRAAGPRVAETYKVVKAYCQSLGPMTVEPTRSGIQFRAGRPFATLKPTTASLRLEFMLDRMVPDIRISEMTEHAPDRLAQAMTVRTPVDIDGRLRTWLKEAYMKAAGTA